MDSIPVFLAAGDCPALLDAYRYSVHHVRLLEGLFQANAASLPDILTVAVGGSLGRLEAGAESDVDCIIVLRDDAGRDAAAEQVAIVHRLFASTPFKAPKADGIYTQGIARRALLDRAALGSLGEAPQVFGKRIQLLLDARPVFAPQEFVSLQGAVVDWYGSDFLEHKPSRAWTYLCNDLARYLHSYAGWQQFKFERSVDDSWQLRQAKLRSSRLLTFAATMFLLGESDRRDDKRDWLKERLGATPLARLHAVMTRHDQAAYGELLGAYEAAHAALAQPSVRAALVASGPDADQRLAAALHPVFEDIRRASAVLSRVLTSFALARHEAWGARFFERWLL